MSDIEAIIDDLVAREGESAHSQAEGTPLRLVGDRILDFLVNRYLQSYRSVLYKIVDDEFVGLYNRAVEAGETAHDKSPEATDTRVKIFGQLLGWAGRKFDNLNRNQEKVPYTLMWHTSAIAFDVGVDTLFNAVYKEADSVKKPAAVSYKHAA